MEGTEHTEVGALLGAISSLIPWANGSTARVAVALRHVLGELLAEDHPPAARAVDRSADRCNGQLSRELESKQGTRDSQTGRLLPASGKKAEALAEAGISTRPATEPQRFVRGRGRAALHGSTRREDPEWPNIRTRLRAAMRQRDVSIKELARQTNVSPLSLPRWMSDGPKARAPDADIKARFVSWLATMDKAKGGQPYQSHAATSSRPQKSLADLGITKDQSSNWPGLRDEVKARIRERGIGRGRAAHEMQWSLASLNHCLSPSGQPPAAPFVAKLRSWLDGTTPAPAVADAASFHAGANGSAAA
jgi:lambda repressor-like predicted transcriptional regulator